jgi:hypothetical protein
MHSWTEPRAMVNEIPSIGLGNSPVPLGQIGSDGERGTVQLIGQKVIAARECLGSCGDLVGKVNGLLVDLKILEHEWHRRSPPREEPVVVAKKSSRTVEQ